MKVLIAEDEISTAKALKKLLGKAQFNTDIVFDGNSAWDYISSITYDVIVLDIMMPGKSGIEVLKLARDANITTPIMMLTAKAEVEDRVAGLDAGADDYLPKPFATNELIARIKALSRRNSKFSDMIKKAGNLYLDCNRCSLSFGDKQFLLTNKELQLMELFMDNPGIVFSTEHLMGTIWGLDSDSEIGVVWTHIGFVRKKLRDLGSDVQIRTIRGVGYCLEVPKC